MRVNKRVAGVGVLASVLVATAVVVPAGAKTASSSATKAPIKVGLIGPALGSPIIDNAGGIAAVKAGVAAINKRGGLAGHKVQLVYCNDKSDPNASAACARKMVDEKVAFETGLTIFGDSVNAPLKAAGIPQIGNFAFSAGEINAPNVYIMSSSAPGYIVGVGYAKAKKLKMAMIGTDNPTASGLYDLIENSAKQINFPLTSKVAVPVTAPDMAPIVASVMSKKPDIIMNLFGQQQEKQFLSALTKSGAKVKNIAASFVDTNFTKDVGGAATQDSRITISNFLPQGSKNAVVKQFEREMNAAYKKGKGDRWADLRHNGGPSVSQWLGLWTVERMLKLKKLKEKDLNAAGITKALNSVKKLNMGGIIPPWTPNAKGPVGQVRVSNPYFFIYGYKNGGKTPVLITKKAVTAEQALAGKFKF